MDSKKIFTQFKRELWENKVGFIYTPLIITGLFLLIALSGFTYVAVTQNGAAIHKSGMHLECNGDHCGFIERDENANEVESFDLITSMTTKPEAFNDLVLMAMYVNCVLLSVILSMVLMTYILRCLFDDRKNKEILFWRSMPVSETTNVLVKLGMQLLAVPFLVLLLNIAVSFVFMIVGSITFISFGVPFGYLLSSIANGNAYYVPLQIFFENIFGLLMLMPVIGYFLCSSAIAKKSPFFTAIVIPVMLVIVDLILKKVLSINLGVVDIFMLYFHALTNVKYSYLLQHSLVLDYSIFLSFVICVSIGAIFVCGAIWLRNNRYEI